MYKEIKVDRNLFHLSNILFDLDNYNFDSDIIKALNDLKTLVDKKLWSSFDFDNYNIMNEDIIVKFLLKNC